MYRKRPLREEILKKKASSLLRYSSGGLVPADPLCECRLRAQSSDSKAPSPRNPPQVLYGVK